MGSRFGNVFKTVGWVAAVGVSRTTPSRSGAQPSIEDAASSPRGQVPLYRERGVSHVWLVEPLAQTLEVLRLHAEGYLLVGSFVGNTPARIDPFDAIEFDLAALWQR